jgi:hypothetical protein
VTVHNAPTARASRPARPITAAAWSRLPSRVPG